jgi:hypothetical protein
MTQQSVVGIYRNISDAEDAVRRLDQGGFPIDHISIIARNLESEKEVHGFITTGDIAVAGVETGAWMGGLFGLLIGAAFLWVPGFGPLLVAGPFAAAILGGVEGAVAGAAGGGLLGALVGWGVSRKHILKYEEHLKGDDYLVIAHGGPEDVKKAHDILIDTPAQELNVHTEVRENA